MQLTFNIFTCILGTISMFIYFHTFFEEKKHVSFCAITFCLFSIHVFTSFAPFFIHTHAESLNTAILIILSFLLTFFSTFLYAGKSHHRIFISLCYEVIGILSELLVYVFFPASQEQSLVATNLQPNYIWNLLSGIISLVIIIVLCHIMRTVKNDYSIQYTITVLITPILSILCIIFTIDYSSYQIHNVYPYQCLLILGFYIINAVHYFLFTYVIRSNKLESENQRLQEQILFQANKYQQISTAYKNTRSILHDTKQHFFFLDNCITSKNYTAMEGYLPTAIQKLEQSYNRINTGNLVIDAFVSNYLSIAENENIQFYTDIKIDTNHIPVNDYDLCIILGNLLDNSIEAVRNISSPKKREIDVHILTKSGNFIIHICNSYYPNFQSSTKKNRLIHGYGCKNIEQITLKSNGTYSNMIEKDNYVAIVSIPYKI